MATNAGFALNLGGLSSALSSNNPVSASTNAVEGALQKGVNLMGNIKNIARSFSEATNEVKKTTEETKRIVDSTKKVMGLENKKKGEQKTPFSNPEVQNLKLQKKELKNQRLQIEIQHNQNISNIEAQIEQTKIAKQQKIESLNEQIIRATTDIQRQQLELQRSQIKLQYDRTLMELEAKLDKAKKDKENALFSINAQIDAVKNKISANVDKNKEQILKQIGLDSLSPEQRRERAEAIRKEIQAKKSNNNHNKNWRNAGSPQSQNSWNRNKTIPQLSTRTNVTTTRDFQALRNSRNYRYR